MNRRPDLQCGRHLREDHLPRWQCHADCYREAVTWATAHRRSFTHYVRARPDSIWYAPMPPLSSLPPMAVHARAAKILAHELPDGEAKDRMMRAIPHSGNKPDRKWQASGSNHA